MQRSAVINVVGLSARHIGDHTPCIRAFAQRGALASFTPTFPALTCSAQSDFVTGKPPRDHGIVGNGWYNREYSEIHFWKQSNRLVQQPKLWDELRASNPAFTCAKLFWWYNMYASVDCSITPRPMYPADGRKVFDIYTGPMGLREEIKRDLGEFPFPSFWGPRAGIASSQWIADSARWIESKRQPTLSLVYLPHLDYNLQRLGPNHREIAKDLQDIDQVVGELLDFYASQGVAVTLLSEYGITEVEQSIHINRALRRKGFISIKDELGLEQLDAGASRAFAVADHQIAHIYVHNPADRAFVRSLVESLDGVERVIDREGQREFGIDHQRSGDLIAIADDRSWFTYYYWLDDALAPDFARCVDIHRKAGYDPAELFIDPKLRVPAAKIAAFLAKKKLGLRTLLDVIPLDATLVRGSHGRTPKDSADWPVFISSDPSLPLPRRSTDVYQCLKAAALG